MNVDLPVDLVQELDEFLDRTGMRKKAFIELALRRALAVDGKQKRRV